MIKVVLVNIDSYDNEFIATIAIGMNGTVGY